MTYSVFSGTLRHTQSNADLLRQYVDYGEVQTAHAVREAKFFHVCVCMYPPRFPTVKLELTVSPSKTTAPISSLTNLRRACSMFAVMQRVAWPAASKVDAQCDKRATELS